MYKNCEAIQTLSIRKLQAKTSRLKKKKLHGSTSSHARLTDKKFMCRVRDGMHVTCKQGFKIIIERSQDYSNVQSNASNKIKTNSENIKR